jgi:hypothetical protein
MSLSLRLPRVSRVRVIFLGAIFFTGISFSWASGPVDGCDFNRRATVSPRLVERTKGDRESPHHGERARGLERPPAGGLLNR